VYLDCVGDDEDITKIAEYDFEDAKSKMCYTRPSHLENQLALADKLLLQISCYLRQRLLTQI
jgi:hypothetical protein